MVLANRKRLKLLLLLSMFFVGGVVGGMSFKHIGFMATAPLAVLLLILAAVPILDDVVIHMRRIRKST